MPVWLGLIALCPAGGGLRKAIFGTMTALLTACSPVAGDGREPPLMLPDGTVWIGGADRGDFCPGSARTQPSAARGTRSIPVHQAPSVHAPVWPTLAEGHMVITCGTALDGFWTAVIYRTDIAEQDAGRLRTECLFLYPARQRQAYRGPCMAGWMQTRNLADDGMTDL